MVGKGGKRGENLPPFNSASGYAAGSVRGCVSRVDL